MHNAWLIAKREYSERIRGKAFRITTVLIPVLIGVLIFVIYIANKNSGAGKHIVVVSSDLTLAQDVRDQLLQDKDANFTVDVMVPQADTQQNLVSQVDGKQLDGFLLLERQPGNMQPVATYESHSSADFATVDRLTNAVSRATMEEQLVSHGVARSDIKSLTGNVSIHTLQIKQGQAHTVSAAGTFWAAYGMAFLLSFTALMYGMNVSRSVIEEKTSRIFEIMLATIKPSEMMAGKLIGVGAVGITQLLIWMLMAAGFLGSQMAGRIFSGDLALHVPVMQVVLFVVYFLLGYLLYSSFFIGIAAAVNTEQELQQFTPLAAVPIWLSFGMITYIISSPNSPLSIAISLFPPCAPITMFLRMASLTPPAWQIALSLALMVLSIIVLLWISSRIYRVGILMYGKRPTLPELLRWLRYA
jgi:ABC-2 type transport system permease protein